MGKEKAIKVTFIVGIICLEGKCEIITTITLSLQLFETVAFLFIVVSLRPI